MLCCICGGGSGCRCPLLTTVGRCAEDLEIELVHKKCVTTLIAAITTLCAVAPRRFSGKTGLPAQPCNPTPFKPTPRTTTVAPALTFTVVTCRQALADAIMLVGEEQNK